MPKLLPEPIPSALSTFQHPQAPMQPWMMQQNPNSQNPNSMFSSFNGEQESAESGLPLTHYLWIVKRHLWKIIAFVTLCTISTYLVTNRMTSIYESTTTIDID